MIRNALVWLVNIYRAARHDRPSPCRFHPSCSAYALEALQNHGAGRGSWLTIKRLLRCQPFGKWGFDPVPPAPRVVEH